MRTYDSYKDSGIEWIGEIPRHWECGPMKYVLSKNDGGVWGEDIEESDTKGVYVIRSTEITIDGKWNLDNPMKRKLNENELVKYKLYENDIVITKSSGSPEHIGKSVIVDRDVENMNCCYSNFVQRIRFYSYNSKLYHYILNSMISREQFRYLTQTTTGLGNLNSNTFNELLLPYIPLTEQEQIVSYLDEKTSLIDEMVEKKKRKIELLKEYRTSLINTVVTKGLNPDVPMKDSGIEWIGKIPRHWESSKLKYLFHIIKNISGELGYDILSVTQKGVKIKDISKNEGQLSMDYSKYQLVNEGQFVMNHMDLLTGFIDISKFNGVTSPDYRVFESYGVNVLDRYYLFIFQLCYLLKIFYGLGSGVSNLGRWRLPSEEFLNFILPLPPLSEQEQIVTYLDEKSSEIDKTIELENKKIELLKEYRQSLISNVVTGKIKVVSE